MSDDGATRTHLHAAFLSGINLGKRRLIMDELRGHVEGFGLADVATFIASGNVVFSHTASEAPALEVGLEAHLDDALGFETDVLIRSFRALEALEAHSKVRSGVDDGFNAHAIFLREEPSGTVLDALHDLEGPDDRFLAVGGDVVWLRRGGLMEAPFSTRDLDVAFGEGARTQRNLNTVRRMVRKFGRA